MLDVTRDDGGMPFPTSKGMLRGLKRDGPLGRAHPRGPLLRCYWSTKQYTHPKPAVNLPI
jgi:hypothetical protein